MKIIVAHPDKQHVFRLATALKKAGVLDCFVTTVYDKPNSITSKVKKILKGKNLVKANSRKCVDLDDSDIILKCELMNLFIVFLSKFPRCLDLCRILRMKLADYFGVKVARIAIKHNCDMIIMFDSTALACFRYLKKKNSNIKCILDTTTVSHSFMKKTFEREIRESGDETLKNEFKYLWNDKLLKRYDDEILFSDYFLAASEIVKESLRFSGVKESQILKVPYGVDIAQFKQNSKSIKQCNEKLKLIFVGQVTCRKGINHLLEAVSKIESKKIELFVAGTFDPNANWYKKYNKMENVHFLGFVTHDQISDLYAKGDLFVLPSLAEGMALVGLEALASGLPVICTQYSGVNDLIINKYNGIVYDAFDDNMLYDNLIWCLENRDVVYTMKIHARITAEKYSWDSYYTNVIEQLFSFKEA